MGPFIKSAYLEDFPRLQLPKLGGQYLAGISRQKKNLGRALETSLKELARDLCLLATSHPKQKIRRLTLLGRDTFGAGCWVGYAYYLLWKSLYDVKRYDTSHLKSPDHEKMILKMLSKESGASKRLLPKSAASALFKAAFYEFRQNEIDPTYIPAIKCPRPQNLSICLISGVFNELFKTHAFERGVQDICQHLNLEYFTTNTSGIRSSQYNSRLLEKQILDYSLENKHKKIWLMAYSKGGIDALHLLHNRPTLANKPIVGLSTLASPILGSEHLDHLLLKAVNVVDQNKVYNKLNKGKDLLAR